MTRMLLALLASTCLLPGSLQADVGGTAVAAECNADPSEFASIING